jgi:hypothetical protein
MLALLRPRRERPRSRAAKREDAFSPSDMDCHCAPPAGVMQLEGTISHLDVLRCGIRSGLCQLGVKGGGPAIARNVRSSLP